ncbi:MAG: VIT1/CCC1 transporter family protein [bacterium]|nr:VIT1/CCC1 transporter family protein [bacterium]
MLRELTAIERKHIAFWKAFFKIDEEELGVWRKIKLSLFVGVCRLFGESGIHLILEAIEVYGIRKYLNVWEVYKDEELGSAVRSILEDEFEHEDTLVSTAIEKKINPETIRNIFLGFNDGLVEILGAVSGFFAAFAATSSVLMASMSVAVAGAISMAAGVFVSSGSEAEVRRTEQEKSKFLGKSSTGSYAVYPGFSAIVVGTSYFIGAMVPVLPVLLGSQSLVASIVASSVIIIFVSFILAFLSGMDVKRRVLINLGIIAFAVIVTYAIGIGARAIWGVEI